jgi:anti-sigma B factor antagonist
MHAIGSDVRIERGADGTTVTFRVPVPRTTGRPRHRGGGLPASGTPATAVPLCGALPPTVRVAGDLDLDGVALVRGPLLAALAPGDLVLDLSGTGYVSSAGVALLVELVATARGRGTDLTLRVAAGSPLARVLDLTGLATVLPVAATV